MIETPNVAMNAEEFIDHVDFFSFGTNDLSQFLMAADRTNANVAKGIAEVASERKSNQWFH